MSLSHLAQTFYDHWQTLAKWIAALGIALLSAGQLIGSLKTGQEANNVEIQGLKQEVWNLRQTVSPLPERMVRVEERVEQSSRKQTETLDEIKTLIVQTRPRNSAPTLRRP